jgi:hypothetical protein
LILSGGNSIPEKQKNPEKQQERKLLDRSPSLFPPPSCHIDEPTHRGNNQTIYNTPKSKNADHWPVFLLVKFDLLVCIYNVNFQSIDASGAIGVTAQFPWQ